MSTLTNQERHALDDVFMSISSSQPSYLKLKFSYYHAYLSLHLKGRLKALSLHTHVIKKVKNTLKITFLQKNSQKNKKTRKI